MLGCRSHAIHKVEPLEARRLLSTFDPPVDPRISTSLNDGWKFIKADVSGAQGPAFNDNAWSTVSTPHTWNAADGQDGGNNYYRGVGWYRRHFTPSAALAGKRLYLKFDGASITTDLYINGTLLGQHKGAFASFGWDVTSLIQPGTDNTIAVKVTNAADGAIAPLGGDYTMFGGIYRSVSLIATDTAHIALQELIPADTAANPVGPTVEYMVNTPGVYVAQSNVGSSAADVEITTALRNDSGAARDLTVITNIVDAAGNVVAETTSTQTVGANTSLRVAQDAHLDSPHLWNGVTDPYMYHVYVRVLEGATTLDVMEQPLGLRSYRIDASQGFILNGQRYELHGVNFHQDRLDKGWALSDADQQQDVDLVKEIGATFTRLAHYQHPQLTYDLLDRAGIGMWSEIPINGTNNTGTVNTPAFVNNAKQQLQEMIRQNYNHPGIFVWGLYNELDDNATNRAVITALNTLAHREDPSRPTTGATNQGDSAGINTTADSAAFNKYNGWYSGSINDLAPWLDNFHATRPNTPVGLGEYGAGANPTQHQVNPTSVNPSGSFHPEEYQNLYHEAYWKAIASRDYVWASLVWNMFDFAADSRNEGSTPGRNDKGLVTYDRALKKDSFYYYKANWSAEPTLYISSRRYTARTAATTEVKIYSNFDTVTLIVNGVTIGTINGGTSDRVFKWTGVQLQDGDNVVRVTGTKNGVPSSDQVTWTLAPGSQPLPTRPALSGTPFARIDFRPAASPAFAGYLGDNGLAYGARNGLTYGWNATNTGNTRTRVGTAQTATPPDARYTTLIQTQAGGTFTWEIAVPNGTYDVHLVAGDPSYSDSTYVYDLEGRVALNGKPTSAKPWVEQTVRVVVTDGKLTLSNNATGMNNKIDYIDINVADAKAPATTQSSFQFEQRHSIRFQFDEAIDPTTLNASDVQVSRVSGTGDAVAIASQVVWDASTNAAEWIFGTPLGHGMWKAVLPAGSIADLAGNALAIAAERPFTVLAGDANRDGTVNFADLVVLAQNYNLTGRTFSQGNFNYSSDGKVDFADLVILAQKYGQSTDALAALFTTIGVAPPISPKPVAVKKPAKV